jgi:hypothetical protein
VSTASSPLSETKLVRAIQALPPSAKRRVLAKLVAGSDTLENFLVKGRRKIEKIAGDHGLRWKDMDEAERERFVDNLLHES